VDAEDFVDARRTVVRPRLIVEPDSASTLRLAEADASATRTETRVTVDVDRALTLRPDACVDAGVRAADGGLFPLLTDLAGLRVCCDYAVFAAHAGVLYLLLIELKSAHASGARRQIESASVLLHGLVGSAALHANVPPPAVESRGIILSDTAKHPKANRGRVLYGERSPRFPRIPLALMPARDAYSLRYLCA
jgi:hypothetical protein